MLEGAVARILNQLLGKYVVDLDTENLNVGIFSGLVQLTDLKLKPEALYELDLPIEVTAGTIGKVCLQIPWTNLWNQSVIVNVEDVHIICAPIVTFKPFDEEKNKRLIRAFKKRTLEKLQTDYEIIGGPRSFTEHLVTNMINNLQFSVNNIHVRYEDSVSTKKCVSAGFCIGSITAENTNSKWKPSTERDRSDTCYYLVKVDALSCYWNTNSNPSKWNLPSDYYLWRNTMSSSLQNYTMNGDSFDFLIQPMTVKLKLTISKFRSMVKVINDLVIQDCHIQLSQDQYTSILEVYDSLKRMFISWNFLSLRPYEPIIKDKRKWWKYAYEASMEQSIRPRTWSRIKNTRKSYKMYMETYKQILLNPNDTELKLDLQKYEDNLSIVNVIIARQQAKLMVNSSGSLEKSFWDMLPTPEKNLLSEKIGFRYDTDDNRQLIEHKMNIRIGNVSVTLLRRKQEIAVLTLTQINVFFTPNFSTNCYRIQIKIEGLVVEGISAEEHLVPIISSEHLSSSPAYFFKCEIEKLEHSSSFTHKLYLCLSSVEILYQKFAFDQIIAFLDNKYHLFSDLCDFVKKVPKRIHDYIERKLLEKWNLNLDITIPFLVLPEGGFAQKGDTTMVMDFGRCIMRTDICQGFESTDNYTYLELEENIYSKLHIEHSNAQILFCDHSDDWRDAKKEKDTELHLIPKNGFTATFATATKQLNTVPRHKYSINVERIKINLSERKLGLLLKFLYNLEKLLSSSTIIKKIQPSWMLNIVKGKYKTSYLMEMQNSVSNPYGRIRFKRNKTEKNSNRKQETNKNQTRNQQENMNEVWARVVDLPGLEDNISPHNNILDLISINLIEFTLAFSRSSDSTDRQYLILRIGMFALDLAFMTFGPAYQISLNNIIVTDKLHTTSSGQYLDLLHSPFPSSVDVFSILYRKVDASCPEFWSHFHGVETSLVADIGTLNLLLHQEAIHTISKYFCYISNKIKNSISTTMLKIMMHYYTLVKDLLHNGPKETPVPPGAIKFSHSARFGNFNIKICDSDYDILNIYLAGFELDILFRANERFVFRSFLSSLNVEHLSDVSLYPKVLFTDEDKVYEIKYVKMSNVSRTANDIMFKYDKVVTDGSLKFYLGQIHLIFLYKLFVQLQSFIINIEGVNLIRDCFKGLKRISSKILNLLQSPLKIQATINICAPILLFPQKSSSPNVIIFDVGEISIENFFKESSDETVENILFKLENATVSRGIMTLTNCLEMQEIIIEPFNLCLDAKRFTYTKPINKTLTWDFNAILDPIHITLGQRDVCIMCCILKDNMEEGGIVNIFPEQEIIEKPKEDAEISVRALETFFCEPKQKSITAKFGMDGIKLSLYFDSGEVLSSPMRDMNHGLCKFELSDISVSLTTHTDKTMDGKLSIDSILVEEIGPNSNVLKKQILVAPSDISSNINCNITVKKPPIIDVTFHQSKFEDKTADVIVGKLTLTLSVSFCEKIATFIMECIPRDNIDSGIVNLGYVRDTPASDRKPRIISLTVTIRVNKPEFIFLIETASNMKRFFITRCEVISDYSLYNNSSNFMLSFSGLHTIFCDFSIGSSEPYLVFKHCDVELSQSTSVDKGNRITFSISSIYIQICDRIIHSIMDVLNDISEYFRVPEDQYTIGHKSKPKTTISNSEVEDLWEPKKLIECVPKCNEQYTEKETKKLTTHEVFLIPNVDIIVILELQEIPVLCFKATAEVTVYDWSAMLTCSSEFTIQANYYNESLQTWEPFIDPVVIDENEYRPWEVLVKIFQDKSLPMLQISDRKAKKETNKGRKYSHSSTATEDDDSGEDMQYLEPANVYNSRNNSRVKTSLSAFLDDSDSETEDFTMEKLATAISDLFTGDWNENEFSESESSSDSNDESEANKAKSKNDTICHYPKKSEKSTYIIVTATERLDITITPTLLKVISEIFAEYSSKTLSVGGNRKNIKLVNDIGPHSMIELYENSNDSEQQVLICIKTFENLDSLPNSPSKQSNDFIDNDDCVMEKLNSFDFKHQYNVEAISSLKFSPIKTPQLYEKVNKHILKIHMDGFSSFQTNCSNRNWEKIIKIQSQVSGQFYHLAVKHSIGKDGRNIIVSSPLQIQNKTCFALSILYQPSVLQQLNLEPVGDVTNPFETTMRIAVLEPHEQYNVPLYIAYHCKLFIQPAYAEGQYTFNSGIWWQDLLTELDSTHNYYCKPKPNSNEEIFSLRIKLQPNITQKNLHSHSIPNYIIYILPPLVFNNFLPYMLEIENTALNQQIKVDAGEKNGVYTLDLTKEVKLIMKIKENGMLYTGTFNYTPQFEEKIVTLSTEEKGKQHILIHAKAERETSYNIYFYSGYWIVNKTGLPLHIKTSISNLIYEAIEEKIVLFSFKRHGKQTLNAKVYDSDWSNEFSLDCANTPGLIVCKHHERKKRYSILLSVKLSEMCPKFTKMVTFLPCFLLLNDTYHNLRIMEHNEKTDLWIDLPFKECFPFWPETNSMQMYVKYKDSKSHSQSFFISTIHRTVLRMDKGVRAAICVEVSGGKTSPFLIKFLNYKPGDAPVLIKNYCTDLFLKIQQQGQGQVTLINPYNSLLYTWDDPLKPRMLVWNIYNNKSSGFLIDVFKDGYGEEKISLRTVNTGETTLSSSEDSDSSDSAKTTLNKKVHRDKITIFWLCYRDGLQRTLVFTQEQRIAEHIIKIIFLEYCHTECFISLAGFGLSVFTDSNSEKEHIYCSISDSPAMWEVNIGHKWKILTLELASWIEDKYRLQYKKCQLKDYVHTDFEKMFMLKPFFAELRRTYTPGAYIHIRKSRNYDYWNMKLNSFQIDNKQPSCNSSLVFYPLPAENIRAQTAFLDLSLFRSCFKNCKMYKLVKLTVSDFFLSIEDQLLLDLNKLFLNNCKLTPKRSILYRNDMTYLLKSITNEVFRPTYNNLFIENLQISQVCIQLNVCKTNTLVSLDTVNLQNFNFLDHIFPMNISPYIQIGSVLLKLKPVELVEIRGNIKGVLFRLWDHIVIHFLQTYYSQVLGLQVLVNPYASEVTGNDVNTLSDVEKSASVSSFAYRCVLGHINMSPAALEQIISDVFSSQNMEYMQRIQKYCACQRHDFFYKAITASSRDFRIGVPLALEQLIAKGVNGTAFCNGELFFKGVGKALFSLTTKQVDDRSNSVQIATEALRRASLLGEPVRIHQRLARYSNKYLGLRPYSAYESIGRQLLRSIANSRYCNDTYWAHSAVGQNGNSLVLVSLEHVIRVHKSTIWGPWDIEWCLDLDDIVSIPKMSTNELVLNVRQNSGNAVPAMNNININGDQNILTWLQRKLEQAIIMSMEEKSWPVE